MESSHSVASSVTAPIYIPVAAQKGKVDQFVDVGREAYEW
jgi:hypothetical protein